MSPSRPRRLRTLAVWPTDKLLTEIESGRHVRLGDALLAAQAVYADTGAFPELLAIYHLFGDPAQKIR